LWPIPITDLFAIDSPWCNSIALSSAQPSKIPLSSLEEESALRRITLEKHVITFSGRGSSGLAGDGVPATAPPDHRHARVSRSLGSGEVRRRGGPISFYKQAPAPMTQDR